jgi:hypothetical protein
MLVLSLAKTSNVHDVKLKANKKGCSNRNDCAIFIKYSFKVDMHPSLQVGQKGVCTTLPLHKEALTLTSSGLGMGSNLNCLALSLLIKMDEGLLKILK